MQFLAFAFFTLIATCAATDPLPLYSYSASVGSGSGSSYTLSGEQRITGIRLWEHPSGYIYGIQICHGASWSNVAGYTYGNTLEMQLYPDEAIVQISGKYSSYIQSIIFVTNLGRSLHAGQPSGTAFNLYPKHRETELVFISGRNNGGLTSIGAHWAVVATNRH